MSALVPLSLTVLLAAPAPPPAVKVDPQRLDAFFKLVVSIRKDADLTARKALARRLKWADDPEHTKGPLAALVRLRAAQEHHVVFAEPLKAIVRYREVVAAPGKDPLSAACREVARRDLARMQLGTVRAALKAYHADQVRYPKRLEVLVRVGLLEKALLTDPWGESLQYKPKPSRLFPDMPDQDYDLGSKRLGPSPRTARDAVERQRFLEKQLQISSTITGGDGKLKVLLRYDPADGVHKPKGITIAPGARIAELKLTAVLVTLRGVVLAGDDFTLVLPRRS